MKSKELKSKELSFVYSEDVAKLIDKIIKTIITNGIDKNIINQSYNLAFEETIKLPEFFSKIVLIFLKNIHQLSFLMYSVMILKSQSKK